MVLNGGVSPEREVSLWSGDYVSRALKEKGYEVIRLDLKDFHTDKGLDYLFFVKKIKKIEPRTVFNALHGGVGEDGTVQKIFELFNINFTGSGSKAALLGMDKPISMLMAENKNIPVAKYIILQKNDGIKSILEKIRRKLTLPIVIKPASLGSSVGISIVKKGEHLKSAVALAFEQEAKIIAQKYIPGKELTVGVLEGKALPVLEVKPKKGWFDYTNKYKQGNTNYEVPAPLSQVQTELVQKYAEIIYRELGCKDYARVDFRFDSDKFYFLEVNILPGITDHSIFSLEANAAGISYNDLLDKITKLSFE